MWKPLILPHSANSANSSKSINEAIDQIGCNTLAKQLGDEAGPKYKDKRCIAICEIISRRFNEKFVKKRIHN